MSSPSPPTRRRNWRSFSLRTLLVLMLLVAVALAAFKWRWDRAQRQRMLVEQLERSGCDCFYDYEWENMWGGNETRQEVHRLGAWLGPDFVHTIASAQCQPRAKLGAPAGQSPQDFDPALWASLAHFRELRHLGLSSCRMTSQETVFSAGPFPKLRMLVINDSEFSAANLATLIQSKDLEELQLVRTDVPDAGLLGLSKCPHLWRFSTDAAVGDDLLATLGSCPSLEEIWLSQPRITDKGLAHLSRLPRLRALEVKGTPIQAAPLFEFESRAQIETLSLPDTAVNDVWLAGVDQLTNLRRLDIAGTQITGAGMLAAKWPASLSDLNVRRTRLTPGCLRSLHQCRSLWRLRLEGCEVASEDIDELKRAIPQCTVFWDGGSAPAP
jgi:hypothetical protein